MVVGKTRTEKGLHNWRKKERNPRKRKLKHYKRQPKIHKNHRICHYQCKTPRLIYPHHHVKIQVKQLVVQRIHIHHSLVGVALGAVGVTKTVQTTEIIQKTFQTCHHLGYSRMRTE